MAFLESVLGFITRKDAKHFRVKGTVKGIKNVYLASQWIQSPGGLPVAVTAGKFTIQRILGKRSIMCVDFFMPTRKNILLAKASTADLRITKRL